MTLREFLYENMMTMKDFANQTGYTQGYISQVIRGIVKPGKMLMYHVDRLTKGRVTKNTISDKSIQEKQKNL